MLTREDLQVLQTMMETTFDRKLEPVKQDISEIKTRLDSMETRMDSMETRLDSMETRLDSMETRLDSMETRMNSMETRMDRMEADIAEIKENGEITREAANTLVEWVDNLEKKVALLR